MAQPVGPNLLTSQADLASVVGAQDQRSAVGLDRFYGRPLRGDQRAGCARGQGDDAVAGAVAGPARARQLGDSRPLASIQARARRLSSATLARRQAYRPVS